MHEELDVALLRRAGLSGCPDGIYQDEEWTVGVVPAAGGLFVGWLDCEWHGPAVPVTVLRDVEHLPDFRVEDELADALGRARSNRAKAMRPCERCGERCIPGHMGATSCHGCMEKYEHVSF